MDTVSAITVRETAPRLTVSTIEELRTEVVLSIEVPMAKRR